MDIFIRGLHNQCTVSDLERALWDPLRKLGIEKWHIRVMRHKGCAILTLLHVHEANYFLQQHGTPSFDRNSRPREQLTAQGRMIYCHAGKQPSDEFILRSLLNPAEAIPNQPNPEGQPGPSRPFQIQSLACGLLEIPGPDPVFVPYWQDTRLGSVTFAHKTLAITLAKSTPYHAERIIIPYNSVQFIGIGNQLHPFIIITLYWAPRFYNEKQVDLSRLFQNLALNPSPSKPSPKFARLLSIDNNHAPVVGTCLVYRLQVPNGHVVSQIYQMLQTHRSPPSHIPWAPKTGLLTVPFDEQKGQLVAEISNASRFGTLNFAIRFQVQRLAQNGVLPPHKVIALLPKILSVSNEHGAIKTAEAIRMLARDIPYVEPDTSPEETSTTALGDRIAEKAACFDIAQSIYGLKERHTHLVLVYRAQVTPTGVYLEGPDAEVTNRVLRKYADHPDHFMRVEFKEDDGRQFRHEKNVSAENVYQNRFRHVLGIGIQVAGRTYRFLGFSHSSLREQSAWFLAPFYHVATQELMVPGVLIGRLGKFSHFLSPARCAARIGQAFSDTSSSIYIGQTGYRRIKDVERVQIVVGDSGPERVRRTFSDGVGTVSRRLLRRIWRENKMWKVAKPTLLQIRFAGKFKSTYATQTHCLHSTGAKGMISLDSRLQGEVLNIRESMIKFESIEDWNLEICGEATKPLPMFLNRQLIKILEDLGVDGDAFISIQRKRIRELRSLITHPLNAETFLEENFVGRSTHIPLLIRMLHDIGHPYQADEFLTHCVEMALLHQVREMKYRGRISLDSTQGATLYGIMDETDFLQEGQVYVAVKRPGWTRSVLSGGRLAVTRSPAMHPGDVQLVSAVEAPPDSPLNELSNCIVFSSKGTRDLPSMLSGGDLDGDQYHVIYDPVLVPNRAVPAANYPRVPPKNLDRVVEIPDMLDFFVDFMEQDRLGQICTAHLQLADQKASGVRDPDCIKLAELASSAVDFSKNGVPVSKLIFL